MKTAFLCSGQGSQYVGMIKDLSDNFPIIKQLLSAADNILNYKISEICFNGPAETLQETRYTQPALFLHSLSVYELLKDKLNFDAIAGHSVGEYAALCIAGVLSFEDALKLVSTRGELMFATGKQIPGTMFSVINLTDEKVIEICNKLNKPTEEMYFVPANFNCPGQVVVSGNADYLRNNINVFKEAGARLVVELKVSGAFHSPLMLPAYKELAKVIEQTTFNNPTIPVYTNVDAKPNTDAASIKKQLIEQIISPVN